MKNKRTELLEEFDKKFFIAGKNALGKWIPMLTPANFEVRNFIDKALKDYLAWGLKEVEKELEQFNEYCIQHAVDFKKRKKAVMKQIEDNITKKI